MTLEEAFINKKMEDIERYLTELKDLLKFSNKLILSDNLKIHAQERIFQLIVDSITSINQHIIKELELSKEPEDPQTAFYILAEKQILPEKFAFKVAPVVAVRNRIVHEYESLDQDLFAKNLRENYTDFEKYLKYIEEYLNKKSA